MNRQQLLFGLALREAGVPLDVSSFDHRLVIQKAVCVLQHAGIHLGYRFRWYLRGPYSTEVASDAFWLAGQSKAFAEELEGWRLDEASRSRIADLKALFTATSVSALAERLELLGSILFMVRTKQAAPEAKDITRLLRSNNKHFKEAEVSEALATLSRYGFAL